MDATQVVVPPFTPAQRDWLQAQGHGTSHAEICDPCRRDLLNIYRMQWDVRQAEELAYEEKALRDSFEATADNAAELTEEPSVDASELARAVAGPSPRSAAAYA